MFATPLLQSFPPLLTAFAVTSLLSFVIGLELHSYRRVGSRDLGFGTTRTLTLLGIIGFALWNLDDRRLLYAIGLTVIGALLAVYYFQRARHGSMSLLSCFIALLTFLLGPVVQSQPIWFTALYVVSISIMLGEKPGIRRFSDAFRSDEAVSLAKFLIISGLVLPLLPDTPIAPFITVTYHQVWLAVLVVSGLSYFSYLLQTYLLPDTGVLLTAVLGGLYSSTATTVVLARRARAENAPIRRIVAGIVLATATMYLRLLIIIFVLGHRAAALHLLAPFAVLIAATGIAAWVLYQRRSATATGSGEVDIRHPLELPTAFLFAFLFVFFAALTQFVTGHYGINGLHVLSLVVGVTDIDPFILALLAGKFKVTAAAVETAIILASGSNNLLKAAYAMTLSRRREMLPAALWLILLFAVSALYAVIVS